MRWRRPLPWASLIALGIETRSWPAPARLVDRTIPALCPFDRFALAVTATRCSGSPRKFAVGALAVAWPLPAAAPVRVGQRNHVVHVELAWMLYHRSGERGPAMHRFRRGRHQLSGSRRRRGSPAAELPGVSPVSPRPRRSGAPSGSDRSRGRRAGSRRRRARG